MSPVHQKRLVLWMVKVTVMRKEKGSSQRAFMSSWHLMELLQWKNLRVRGLGSILISSFIVCIMLRKGLNDRMFYLPQWCSQWTCFASSFVSRYLWMRKSLFHPESHHHPTRSLLPQQGGPQNAEGVVMKSQIFQMSLYCLDADLVDMMMFVWEHPKHYRSSTLFIFVYASETLKHLCLWKVCFVPEEMQWSYEYAPVPALWILIQTTYRTSVSRCIGATSPYYPGFNTLLSRTCGR